MSCCAQISAGNQKLTVETAKISGFPNSVCQEVDLLQTVPMSKAFQGDGNNQRNQHRGSSNRSLFSCFQRCTTFFFFGQINFSRNKKNWPPQADAITTAAISSSWPLCAFCQAWLARSIHRKNLTTGNRSTEKARSRTIVKLRATQYHAQ